jgi:uncharacterized membrane protein YGL010W
MKKTVNDWFNEYGESHQNPTNKAIHWICVPIIFFCVIAFLSLIPLPNPMHLPLSLTHFILFMASIFYLRLSWKLALGTIAFASICLWFSLKITELDYPLGYIALALFAAAWVGQFYGHHIEGKKPSFLKDLQFLMIGPFWLMGLLFAKLNITY